MCGLPLLAGMPEVKPMSVNIQAKNDTSFLFSGISAKNDSFNSMSWLKDYGLVKSGAYSKLMKAYYADPDKKSETASKITNVKNPVKEKSTVSDSYSKLSEAAGSVKSSVKSIQDADEEDKDLLLSTVKNFVKSYNSMVKAAEGDDINDASISGRLSYLTVMNGGYSEKMSIAGISTSDDGTLKLDEDKLKAADAKDIKDLFAEKSSYGYSVSVSASMIQSNADYAATRASLYNGTGTSITGSYGYSFDLFT